MATAARKIIMAMDGSKHSDYAFDWYVRYFHRETDNLVLVTCAEQVSRPTDQGQGDEMVSKLMDKITNAKIKGEVKRMSGGKPGELIVKACNEMKADLIITGSRGLGTLRRTLMGSVSTYIVHHSRVPVLVVRQ